VLAVKGSLRRGTNWRAVDGCAPFRPGGHRDGRLRRPEPRRLRTALKRFQAYGPIMAVE